MNVLPEETTAGKFDTLQLRNHKVRHYIPEAVAMIRKILELVRIYHIQFDTYSLESEDEYHDDNLIQICIQPRQSWKRHANAGRQSDRMRLIRACTWSTHPPRLSLFGLPGLLTMP